MKSGKLTAYSGMTTKIRAMKKRLLSSQQYEEITGLKTVSELFNMGDLFILGNNKRYKLFRHTRKFYPELILLRLIVVK